MITFDAAKNNFFDKPAMVAAVERANKKNLGRAGGLVRTIAKNSIKTRRQKVKDQTTEERKKFKIRVAIAKFYGRPRPKRPVVPGSKAGDAPANVSGLLKRLIFHSWDSVQESAVAGPNVLPSAGGHKVLSALEYGGRSNDGHFVAARPFMRPAEETARAKYPKFWKNSI